ncbi:DUF2357 domain-containing protein [Mycolicibacterium hassiacum]|jgi:hypothetical protein|uniref:DUF2357 domain-containing protein n=1 Tax=Mycolicibacterium hassiacum TaxID=46351 RepID=UPI0009D94EE2|nr:DUF2357 domain-containing protein [Mycolicibacterium hassiacum]
MVTKREFLTVVWGAYTLRALTGTSRPPFSPTRLCFKGVDPEALSVYAHGINLTLNSQGDAVVARPLVRENDAIDVYIDGPLPSTLSTAPNPETIRSVFRQGDFQHFTLRYRGSVGDIRWCWSTPNGQLVIQLESFPTKLDYREDFAAIRKDLERIAPMLTASASGAAGAEFAATSEASQSTALEWMTLVNRELNELTVKMGRLLPVLRRRVDRTVRVAMSDRLRNARPISHRHRVTGWRSTPVLVQQLCDSDATPLNGHLRWEVDQLRAVVMGVASSEWYQDLNSSLRLYVDQLFERVNDWSKALAHIPPVMHLPNLQTNLRDPLYEGAFRHLRALKNALVPLQGASLVGLKDLPTLYEYWVYLSVVAVLRRRFTKVVSITEPLVQRVGSHLVMVAGRRSRITMRDDLGREIRCEYNRAFMGLPTTDQRPDSVIWIGSVDRMLIIDAKYRVQNDSDYVSRFGMPGPLAEDINTIHRYRDAIVHTQAPHRRIVYGGLVAFPGRDSARYRNHRFYRSWHAVRIGGVPMLPNNTAMMEELLDAYLSDLPGGA